ncbi:MAG: hypothetical protein HS115_02325 [Spirochaetales bacterium]|nr:hypothetical protein [Spirochaetales bacterium]
MNKQPFRFRALYLVVLLLAGCLMPGMHIPPGNRPQRGPNAMRTGTDYYTSHEFLVGAYHNTGFYRTLEEAMAAFYMPLATGLIYSRYTMPIAATAQPVGQDTMSYSAVCMFWIFCANDEPIRASDRLKSIHAIDAEILSVLLGMYTRRTIIFSGYRAL